ncbi:MAG: trigger factor [Gammaproteobacteria bacterium]|nr:trigger factor [Gammaproteobacteria bacterium]
MQISVEKSSALERRVTVEVPEERIEEQIDSRLQNLRKSVRIDGFRQGKAPLKVVRQRFGERVRAEIVGEMLQSTIAEAITSEDLKPAGQPVIDPVSSAPGKGLTYTATFEVYPEIDLAPVEQLDIEKYNCEIDEKDVDAMIERLREQNREWLAVERPSQEGDQLNINFEGTVDGESFDGGTGDGFDLMLGTGTMIEGFEAQLTGKSAGEQVGMDLRFPEEYRNEDLAGKAVKFEVTVNKVSEPVLPEVNGAFMEKFGGKDGDMGKFRAEVRENMEKERERALRQRLTNEVLEKINAANDVDVPASLVKGESQRLAQQMAQEFMMRGVNPAVAGEELEGAIKQRAENRVKLGLIMAEIIKTAELKAPPEKVREMIEKMASSYEDPAAVVKYYYDNAEQLQQVEGTCLEEEAVNWIAERAILTETRISFDALMDPVQTDNTAEAGS